MTACETVGRWITENVLVPVAQFFETLREKCSEARRWVEREVRRPVERYRTREERRCKRRDCNWWCACCNKWLCWIVTVVVKVIEYVIEVVGEWVVETVCKLVTELVRIVVMTVLRVLKWVVDFVVCLFTRPLSALLSVADLWFIVVDVVDDVVNLASDVLDAVVDLLEITEVFIQDLGESFGFIGRFVAMIATWILNVAQSLIRVVRDVLETLQDIVVGILHLDPCRVAEGGANLAGAVLRAIATIGQAIGFGYLGSGRDVIQYQAIVAEMVDNAITEAFPDEDTRQRALDNVQIDSPRFGLPVSPQLLRMTIRSRGRGVDLRALHEEGALNLLQAAGYPSGCPNNWFDRPRLEVVYRGTRMRVTPKDLELFLAEGPDAVAEFEVHAITKRVYERYYRLAKRKARLIGIRLEDVPIESYVVTERREFDMAVNGGLDQQFLFNRLGRTGDGDPLCKPPAIAVFQYQGGSYNGLTTWYRPPRMDWASGVTFRDRQPAYLFRWVLIHELGHYFGLDHDGHDGAHHIMFTGASSAGLDPVTETTVLELILFSGEPVFTVTDAINAWDWITENARDCVLGEE